MSDKVSDKTEYKTARDRRVDCANNTYCLTEKLAEEYCDVILAEGERKGIAEYAKGEAERRTAIHGHGFQLGVEEGERKERNRIEGVIADKLDCYECYDVANKAQLVWAIKKAIAEE